jgi:hypothetical protein
MFVEGEKETQRFCCGLWTTDDLSYCFLPLSVCLRMNAILTIRTCLSSLCYVISEGRSQIEMSWKVLTHVFLVSAM